MKVSGLLCAAILGIAGCDRHPAGAAPPGTTSAAPAPSASASAALPPRRIPATAEPTAAPYSPPPEPSAASSAPLPARREIGTFEDWLRASESDYTMPPAERKRPPQLRLAKDLALKTGLLAYERSGDVFVHDFATGKESQLTRGAQRNLAPTFLHGTPRIAFLSNREGMVYRVFTMGLDGSDPRPVSGRIRPSDYGPVFALSPDDRLLATVSGSGIPGPDQAVELHLVDLATGQDERVGEPTSEIRHLSFSARGDAIYYVGGGFDDEHVVAVDVATRRVRSLPNANNHMFGGPVSLGDRILYAAGGTSAFCCRVSHLFTTARDGTGIAPLGTYAPAGSMRPLVSPDGARIAASYFVREGGFGATWRSDVTILGAAGGVVSHDLAAAFPRPFYRASSPAWAPDSRHVAFTLSLCAYAECKPEVRSVVVVDASDPAAVPAFIGYGGEPEFRPAAP